MKAIELYNKLEADFIKQSLLDEWFGMEGYGNFLSENFKKRSMGVVCDFADKINHVYSAVFPTKEVMQKIINDNAKNAMLFLHHPLIWDITKVPSVFQTPEKEYIKEFKKRKISLYCLHVPLDNFSEYSTSNTLSNELGIKIIKPFAKYFGSLAGVFGKTEFKTILELKAKFEEVVNHKVSLYNYGNKNLKSGDIAVVAGGGNDLNVLREMVDAKIYNLITGITALNNHSEEAHKFAKKHKINLFGGTHYSTEVFACKKMCEYFKKLGLPGEFIKGKASMEDL